MGELLFTAVVEGLRVFGAGLRRKLFREEWDEGNDGIDVALGFLVAVALVFLGGVAAFLWFR